LHRLGCAEWCETENTGEDEEGDSELKYLEMIRKIRDENPDLFEKIKKLPKKARSGFIKQELLNNQLVSFLELGNSKNSI